MELLNKIHDLLLADLLWIKVVHFSLKKLIAQPPYICCISLLLNVHLEFVNIFARL